MNWVRDAKVILATMLATVTLLFWFGNRAGDALIGVGARLKQAGTAPRLVLETLPYNDELPVATLPAKRR